MIQFVVFCSNAEAYDRRDDVPGAYRVAASLMEHYQPWTADEVFVEKEASKIPGLMDQLLRKSAPNPNARIHIMPMEHIRLAFGSAHDKLRLAAIRAGVAP